MELGIQQIFPRSPQAKGRVERMTRTFEVKLHPFHDCPAPQRQSGVSPVQVTVQTCGDLPTIRPIVEGQPSTVFPLQTVSVPSNVNSYSASCVGEVDVYVFGERLLVAHLGLETGAWICAA